MLREALGIGKLKWWWVCHAPAWPWKTCVVCGKRFRRKPWWNANWFEEHCSRECADYDLEMSFYEFKTLRYMPDEGDNDGH